MLSVNRYELNEDVRRYELDGDEEIPDAPDSWALADFDDLPINDIDELQDFDLH